MPTMEKLGTILLLLFLIGLSSCKSSPSSEIFQSSSTPTPTDFAGDQVRSTEQQNVCNGLSGAITLSIVVGPSEVVGMNPVAIGDIPFGVVVDGGIYTITGGGPIDFDEQVYEAEWGSYTVDFAADTKIHGVCDPSEESETLSMTLEMTGEQLVVVEAEGFQGEYPWEGTRIIDVNLPVQEGAQQEGEGWVIVLHLFP